jgi:ribonuclease D
MNTPHSVYYIDTSGKLEELCRSLMDCDWLALDTEFLREKTYFSRFCLLQIATETSVACIDPLALSSLTPLLDLLYTPGIVKVFHAGRQDLEIFFHLWGRLPRPIFDTQLAAPLLGFPEQISYASLVFDMLGIRLEKSHSRTDWSRRPLSQEQLRYAAEDVIYLGMIYQKLRAQLTELRRLDWLDDDFNKLVDPALYENRPELAWQRVTAAHQLKGAQLSVLQTLAAWREEVARREDLPRNWLLRDEVMLDLARIQPTTPEELASLRGIGERVARRRGGELCQLIREARNRPPQDVAARPKPTRRTAEQEALLDVLMGVVRLIAERNRLNPAVIGGRKDLEQLLDTSGFCRLQTGWRKNLVGDELEAILRGAHSLSVVNGQLRVNDHA